MSTPDLSSLSDQELLMKVHTLIVSEHRATLSILLHLNEVERRKLHAELGYGSMYEYCIEHLQYSASAAGRRIHAARCIRRFPDVVELLKSNAVTLNALILAAPIIRAENKDELLAKIKGKSQREVEAIVAAHRPPMFLRDRVRPVRVRVPLRAPAVETAKHMSLSERSRSGSKKPSKHDDPQPRVVTVEKIERRLLVQFAASSEFMNKVARVKSLLAGRFPAGVSFEQVFEVTMDLFLEKHHPEQRKSRREKRGNQETPAAKTAPHGRHIPAATRDNVFTRDGGRCTYVGPDGRRCSSTYNLQVDHVVPFAQGGPSTESNLRLLCALHNRLEAEKLFGRGRGHGNLRSGPIDSC